ncbi:enoyl-CoA hydratase/isomerase family protein [Bordetella genomosp. 12]|uniref:Enoyl-CoA hydratase n=1 Tax=Bordetella genomosp. 12 TaxID=463035 RepID=A0A261VUR5_9BORD|nr:enoyl-CoA hydratase/isomerase family protein [Bordetella genomosp. 12]OZI77848.1 enoyl-CoA hydratase [Bordetella genomosp. 12]
MPIRYEVQDAVATIVIDRPERRNALDHAHYEALSQAWCQVRDDPQVRAAIITGAGDQAFCAGADLKSFVNAPPTLSELMLTQQGQLLNRGLEVWKPVVAAVNGYCLGGGMTLLLATDLRLCVPQARFGLTEVKRGAFPANGGTQRVARQLPHAIAMELLLLGDAFDAARAERWGIVNEVVPAAELMTVAQDYARRLAANAPLAVQAAKELAVRSRDLSLAEGLRMEQLFLRLLQGSEDVAEGVAAFAERRPAVFQGK